MSCAKTAKPIDLPFGLWTRVGRRKHKFNRICQVAPVCSKFVHIGATWRIRLNRPPAAAMRPYMSHYSDHLLLLLLLFLCPQEYKSRGLKQEVKSKYYGG